MAEHLKNETDDSGLFIIPETDDMPDVPPYIMPDYVYDVLKWVGLIVCYALAIFIRKVGGAWHFDVDTVDALATTVEAFGLFIGMCIGASQISSMGR